MPESSNLSCWSGTWPTEQFPGLTQDLLHHCQSVLATSALMWQLSLDLLLLCFLFSCAVPSVDDYVAPTSCHLGLLPVGQPPHAAPWQVAHFSLQKVWEAATCVLPRSPTFHSGTCMVLTLRIDEKTFLIKSVMRCSKTEADSTELPRDVQWRETVLEIWLSLWNYVRSIVSYILNVIQTKKSWSVNKGTLRRQKVKNIINCNAASYKRALLQVCCKNQSPYTPLTFFRSV